ncbi:hypothetical protein SCLCIDRAFT_492283 [Scleroderma citrinum Foug A]|uniref:CUB domain-containing protein n=1 Tax=Scleroderma citrinum Foug A TaxID=1036808 RepID=A0A0C3EP09_9AGAM|nr:hypothetical protein SCLCIDRAFT_492283 [Scleroderma citrinum Foug A]
MDFTETVHAMLKSCRGRGRQRESTGQSLFADGPSKEDVRRRRAGLHRGSTWHIHESRHPNLAAPRSDLYHGGLRQVYLRYQDSPHRNTTFEINDSTLAEKGIICCNAYPKKFSGNTLTLTSTNPLCVKVYSDSLTNHRFVVGFGQSFGKD